MYGLVRRYRRQASSHILIFGVANSLGCTRPMWEPGLPAMAVCQSMNVWAGPPLSQASQLPHFDLQCGKFIRQYAVNVGAGLAREGGVSVDECMGWYAAIAGKPAPTF